MIDRPTLLRAIASLNERGMATAPRVADYLSIPADDARALCVEEVAEGFLLAQKGKRRFEFVWYSLTETGSTEARRAA